MKCFFSGVILVGILSSAAFPSIALSCNYYASPTGSGHGLTPSSPFKISDFWSKAGPGKTLCLLNGTYRGANSMIRPPLDLGGTQGNPITIRAMNDGKVDIDGEDQRLTVRLYRNNYFVLEGFNAHNAFGGAEHASIVAIDRSKHVTVRRVVGWDTQDGNRSIFSVSGSGSLGQTEDILLEDVAGFGVARKIFSAAQSGDSTVTIRRAWGRWEGSHHSGPKMTYTLAYNNYNMTVENSIGAWSGERMAQSYRLICKNGSTYSECNVIHTNFKVDQPYGIFGMDRIDDDDKHARSKLLGSIAYITPSDRYAPSRLFVVFNADSIEYANNVAFLEPGSHEAKQRFQLIGVSGASNLIARNLTGIGGSSSSIASMWQVSNFEENASSASVESIYTEGGGAQVCKRYKDRVLTNEPLWPWPMDQRIKDAIAQSGHRSVTFGMANDTGYVTDAIEQMFGSIPQECGGNQNNSLPDTLPPAPPTNLRLVQN